MHLSSVAWKELVQIQKIRNVCAHQDGSILDKNGKEIEAIKSDINSSKYLSTMSNGAEVFLEEGYLFYVHEVFTKYLQLVGNSIEAAESA